MIVSVQHPQPPLGQTCGAIFPTVDVQQLFDPNDLHPFQVLPPQQETGQ